MAKSKKKIFMATATAAALTITSIVPPAYAGASTENVSLSDKNNEETKAQEELELNEGSLNEELSESDDLSKGSQILSAATLSMPDTIETDDFLFSPTTGTILQYIGTSSEVVVPEEIEGVSVTKIGDSVFNGLSITSVILPETLVSIGNAAFQNNPNLTSIVIPDGVKNIGAQAFYKSGLTSIKLPSSLETMGRWAFKGNFLTSITIPNSLEILDEEVFMGNQLTEIVWNQNLKELKFGAFMNNPLTSVVIPDSIEIIGDSAFAITEISQLTLGNSVHTIGESSFANSKLTELTLPESLKSIKGFAFQNNQIKDIFNIDGVEEIGVAAFENNKIKELDLSQNNLTVISSRAFSKNSLSTITIPDTVIDIQSDSFSYNNISEINLGNSVENIGQNAFLNASVKVLHIPSSVKTIGNSAFANHLLSSLTFEENSNLENISSEAFSRYSQSHMNSNPEFDLTIPKSVKSISWNAFEYTQIRNLTFENDSQLEYIQSGAFLRSGIDQIEGLGEKLKSIGSSAFERNNFTHIEFPASLETVGFFAFMSGKLVSISFAEDSKLRSIGSAAFYQNKIETIENFPQQLEVVEDSVFSKNAIKSPIIMSDTVVSIGAYAFSENQIPEVRLSKNLIELDDYAFRYNKIKSIEIPDSVTTFGAAIFDSNELENVKLSETMTVIPGSMFSNNKLTSVEIPKSVSIISGSAFANNKIEELVINNNVKEIQGGAFVGNSLKNVYMYNFSVAVANFDIFKSDNNDNLTIHGYKNSSAEQIALAHNYNFTELVMDGNLEADFTFDTDTQTIVDYVGESKQVKIPDYINGKEVLAIGDNAFKGKEILSVKLPSMLEKIGTSAFENSLLIEVEIPSTVKEIGANAFKNNRLAALTIPNAVETIGESAFENNAISTLNIGSSVKEIGAKSFKENKIQNIQIPDSVVNIGDEAFYKVQFTALSLGNNVKTIGNKAFAENYTRNLAINIPDSVISIGAEAFSSPWVNGKVMYRTLTLGASLETIGSKAFHNNRITNNVVIPPKVKVLENYVFQDSWIYNIDLANVEEIKDSALSGNKFTSIDISRVKKIGYMAFYANSLTHVDIPEGIELGTYAFTSNAITSFSIPDSMTEIPAGTFSNNSITELPSEKLKNVKKIGASAFSNNKITQLTLGDNIEEIGSGVFSGNKIAELHLSKNLSSIPDYAFSNNALTSLELGEKIKEVGRDSFSGNKIVDLIGEEHLEYIGGYAFSGNKITELNLGDKLTEIGYYAFYANSLTSLVIPDSVHTINIAAFASNKIENLSLGKGLQKIPGTDSIYAETGAFANNKLKFLIIPKNLTTVYNRTFRGNDILTIVSFNNQLGAYFDGQNHKNDSNIIYYSTPGGYSERYYNSTKIHKFKDIREFDFEAFLLEYGSDIEIGELGLITVDVNPKRLKKNVHDVTISGYSFDKEVEITVADKIYKTEVSENKYSLTLPYVITEDLEEPVKVKDKTGEDEGVIKLAYEQPSLSAYAYANELSRNNYEVTVSGYSTEPQVTIKFGDFETRTIDVEDESFSVKFLKEVDETIEVEIITENGFNEPEVDTVTLKYVPDPIFDVEVTQNKRDENFVDVTLNIKTNASDAEILYNILPGFYNEEWDWVELPKKGEPAIPLGYMNKNSEWVELPYTSDTLQEINLSSVNWNWDYNYPDELVYLDEIDFNDPDTFVGKTLRSGYMEVENGEISFTLPNYITEDVTVWIYIDAWGNGYYENETLKRIDLKFSDEEVFGTVNVKYVDEEGNILDSKTVTDLELGKYSETAIEIEGYTLQDDTEKTVELTKDANEKEIIFTYKKNEPEVLGSITVNYEDEEGTLLDSKILTDLTLETYTEEAIEIEDYELQGDSTKSVELTKEQPNQTITFVYKKNEPEVFGSITVNYEDEEGNLLNSKSLTDLTLGNYTEAAIEFEGYELQGDSAKTVELTKEQPNQTITFVYKKIESEILGTITVRYEDEEGNLLDSKTLTELTVGIYTENAIEIEGYELQDLTAKTVEITKEQPEHTITFLYNKIVQPEPEVILGSITVRYENEEGTLLDSKVINDLSIGIHTENAIEIEGYELQDSSTKAVEITKDQPNQSITFVYRKEEIIDPDPTDPDPTEPEPTEPEPTEPEPIEPEPTEPEPIEPEPTEPEPIEPEPIEPEPIEPEPTKPEPIDPEPIKPEPIDTEPTKPEPIDPEPTKPEPIDTEPIDTEPTKPEPTKPEPVKQEPTKQEPTQPEVKIEEENPLPPKTGDGSSPGKTSGGLLALILGALGLHLFRRKENK